MRAHDTDIAWFRELLASLGRVEARRMFGGTGLYAGGTIVALEIEGTLYLKTDATTRDRFRDAGGRPFVYDNSKRAVETSYWTPPDEAMDSAEAMRPWASLAQEAAQRAAAAKPARKKTTKTPATQASAKPTAKSRPSRSDR